MPKFLGEIKPNGGDFVLLDSSYVRGGFMQVDTIEDRDSILADKLKIGMHVYVNSIEQIFEWKGDRWKLFTVPISNIGEIQFLTSSQEVKGQVDSLYDDNNNITHYGISFEGNMMFHNGDIIGWDFSSDENDNIIGKYAEINIVRNNIIYIKNKEGVVIPEKYTRVYLVGSTSDVVRRCVTVIHPYKGASVISQFINISTDNVNTNYSFRLGQHSTNKWKIYGEDVYLKGTFIDEKNRNLSDLVTLNQETLETGITNLRREFGYENLLDNPFFINGLQCWVTKNTATYFKLKNKFILTNKTLLTTKRDGAYVTTENGQIVLKLVKGFILQKNSNLKQIIDLDTRISPYYVTFIFSYKAISAGTFRVGIINEDTSDYAPEEITTYKAEKQLFSTKKYQTFRSSFLWNGTGDFRISYTGDIRIQALVIKINDIKTFEREHSELFKYKDILIQMAKEYQQKQ